MTFIVNSRAKRTNPEQEKIVSEKDELNSRTSKLIKLLIDTKKSWNGKPSPEIGVSEKTPITEPLPAQTEAAAKGIEQLTQSLLGGLNQVTKDQFEYSQNRKQKIKDKANTSPKPISPIAGFSNDLSGLVKNSSNIFTRVLSHIYAPFISETEKWERLRLLRSLAEIERNLREINDLVLTSTSSSPDGVLKANYKLRECYVDAKASFFDPLNEKVSKLSESMDSKLKEEKEKAQAEGRVEDAAKADDIKRKEEELAQSRQQKEEEKKKKEVEQKEAPKTKPEKLSKPEKLKKEPKPEKNVQKPTPTIPPKAKKTEKANNTEGDQNTSVQPEENEPIVEPKNDTTLGDFFGDKINDFFFMYRNNYEVLMPFTETVSKLREYVEELKNSKHQRQAIDEYREKNEGTDVSIGSEVIVPIIDKLILDITKILETVLIEKDKEDKELDLIKSYKIQSVKKNKEIFKKSLVSIFEKDAFLESFLTIFYLDINGNGVSFNENINFLSDPQNEHLNEDSNVYLQCAESFIKAILSYQRKISAGVIIKEKQFFSELNREENQDVQEMPETPITTTASNPLSRWYNRLRTQYSFQNDRHVRLSADQAINTCVQKVNYTMDLLEKGPINFKHLIKQMRSILISMRSVFEKMIDLVEMYNAGSRIQDSDRKIHNEKPMNDSINQREVSRLNVLKSQINTSISVIDSLEDKAEALSKSIKE